MGRQFTYICLAEDLDQVQSQVLSPAGAQLVADVLMNGEQTLVPVERFALSADRMGREALLLYVLPPRELQREVRSGQWIDSLRSNLIEAGRCFTDGHLIRPARFWYETSFFEGPHRCAKQQEFVAWAERVFCGVKKLLQRRSITLGGSQYEAWFGPQAWREVSGGRLAPVSI